jgi:hypothetical protein
VARALQYRESAPEAAFYEPERTIEIMKGKYGLDFASEVRELRIARYYLLFTSLVVLQQMFSLIFGK